MSKRVNRVGRAAALTLLVAMIASPQAGSAKDAFRMSPQIARHLSGAVATRYYLSHPEQAPAAQQTAYKEAARMLSQMRGTSLATPATGGLGGSDVFNLDNTGLPQNEESVSVCGSKPKTVISGTNDYRYVLDPEENSTGWDLSTNGGASVVAEGLLPHLDFGGSTFIPSGGDPVYAFDNESCAAYAANLNYDITNYFPNGIGVYRSTPATLKSCPGGSDPACWPSGMVVAQAPDSTHFLDKEWMDVGNSGDAGKVVWVTWSDFLTPDPSTPEVFTASIWAARCDALLTACTAPINISGTDPDIQFSDVTVGSDGRIYVTWAEVQGELTGDPETFVIKMRIADAGTTSFGPTQVVATVGRPIGFDNTLYGHTFRVATNPKSTMKMVNGSPREFVVWEQCALRPLGYCQDPSIQLAYSDDDGATWTQKTISAGGDNYFPTIDADNGKHLAVAYFTSRFDPVFGLGQDVELVTVDPATLAVTKRQRLTSPSNNPNADWFFSGGIFIGDYIEVAAHDGMAYVAYNANYQKMKFLGTGRPEGQQDNYLTIASLK